MESEPARTLTHKFVHEQRIYIYQPRTQALWFVTSLSARGKAREGEKWKIRREAPGRIRIQNGGSVFCKCSVLFLLLLK
jgi:hypothetical protein